MKSSFDTKSVLLGSLLGACAAIAVAAVTPGTAAPADTPASSGQIGRYQISGTGNHGLVLDTTTGKVWSAYFSSSGGTTSGSFFKSKVEESK